MRTATALLTTAWILSCTPAMTQTQTRTPPSEIELEGSAAVAEVEQLHGFFVQWFRGELPATDAAFARFSSALAPEFEMVVPSGALLEREQVLAGVRGGHGQWRGDEGAMIEVRNAKAHAFGGGLVRVSYEEWQRQAGEWKARRSTALLRRVDGERIEWVHVHETWVAQRD